jgi:hypothetical protein
MMEWNIVQDSLRDPYHGQERRKAAVEWNEVDDGVRGPSDEEFEKIAEVLVRGGTVHVTGIDNSILSSWYTKLFNRTQRRMKRRLKNEKDHGEGYYVWLSSLEESKLPEAS